FMHRSTPRSTLFPYTTLFRCLQQILDGDLKILVHEAASRSVIALPSARLAIAPVVTNEARIGAFDGSFSIGLRHGLSEREEQVRSEEHTSELQSLRHLVCRLL